MRLVQYLEWGKRARIEEVGDTFASDGMSGEHVFARSQDVGLQPWSVLTLLGSAPVV